MDSATDDFSSAIKKAYAVRGVIITAITLGIIMGISSKDPLEICVALPAAGVISLTSFMPFITFLNRLRNYRNGSFFAKYSWNDVIEEASNYAEAYNTFEINQEYKKRKKAEKRKEKN